MSAPFPDPAAGTHLLLLDPDPHARLRFAALIRAWGYRVTDSSEAALLDRVPLLPVDLALIDPSDAREAGWGALTRLRQRSRLPVVVLLQQDSTLERVLALERGADAVLAKDGEPRELQARIKALLRPREGDPAEVLMFGRFRLEPMTRRLSGPGGFCVVLSQSEYKLLRAFLERPHSVLQRQELLHLARGDGVTALERSVDLMVSRLRQKLNDDPSAPLIRTVRGIGYLFDPPLR
ncbi:response regulator transcription factor [Mitsuaria sp. GD03876]|uniref:response regulator transcription factor n=1 Tax=Mitsuaria sp. GD03876 TaxID=2975399 RepID=UPI00244C9253|nr:response regulator transcription factor [Mitsuaria sp. GD03876]MDH0866588.1 response regulator transcription factor [Mitsuaria sp. GD03876]